MKKVKFWVLIAIYLLLAFADGALTYINTPDLFHDSNPLIAELGLGWGALAIANIAVFLLIFAAAYYSYCKYQTVYTNERKFTKYYSQIVFNRPDMFWKGALLLPKNWSVWGAAFGVSLLYSGIAARLILVLEWSVVTLYHSNIDQFRSLYKFYVRYYYQFGGRLHILVAIAVMALSLCCWFYAEFRKQLKNKAE